MKNFETVKVAGTTEKIMQTIVCIITATVATISAIGIANGIHAGHYASAVAWAIVTVLAFRIFVLYVIGWGESKDVK